MSSEKKKLQKVCVFLRKWLEFWYLSTRQFAIEKKTELKEIPKKLKDNNKPLLWVLITV